MSLLSFARSAVGGFGLLHWAARKVAPQQTKYWTMRGKNAAAAWSSLAGQRGRQAATAINRTVQKRAPRLHAKVGQWGRAAWKPVHQRYQRAEARRGLLADFGAAKGKLFVSPVKPVPKPSIVFSPSKQAMARSVAKSPVKPPAPRPPARGRGR